MFEHTAGTFFYNLSVCSFHPETMTETTSQHFAPPSLSSRPQGSRNDAEAPGYDELEDSGEMEVRRSDVLSSYFLETNFSFLFLFPS